MGEPTFDCLFPIEQRVTGMNSAVQTASLTGRILFFYCSEPLLTSDLIRSTESVHPPLFASPPNPPGICRECSNGSLNVGTSPSAEAPNALSGSKPGASEAARQRRCNPVAQPASAFETSLPQRGPSKRYCDAARDRERRNSLIPYPLGY